MGNIDPKYLWDQKKWAAAVHDPLEQLVYVARLLKQRYEMVRDYIDNSHKMSDEAKKAYSENLDYYNHHIGLSLGLHDEKQ